MALTATIHRFKIALSDVDRGVYETLDLRVAQHPSETTRYMITRVLAFCLSYEEGLEFCPNGLSGGEEPAAWSRTLDGRPRSWIEVGSPSAERLHRASKAYPAVKVFTHHDPSLLARECERATIHRVESIEAFAVDPKLLDALEGHVERNTSWELTHTDGQLYVTSRGQTLSGTLTKIPLGSA